MTLSTLTTVEWDAIYARAKAGESVSAIARDLGRDSTNMYRYLARNYGYRALEHRRAVWAPTVTPPTEPAAIGYMAGIIDGEGSLMERRSPSALKRSRFTVWILRVNMQHRETIEWLHQFGGTFRIRKRAANERSDQYEWMVARQLDVEALLTVLLPHLIVKREMALKCLADLASRKPAGHDGRRGQFL